MLARPTEMTRVLDLCQTALHIVDYSNPARLSNGTDAGTFIAHCHDVKIVLYIPPAPDRKRLIDIWHNRIVLSVEWGPRGAEIHKFYSGKWEELLQHGADAMQADAMKSEAMHPRLAVGWS